MTTDAEARPRGATLWYAAAAVAAAAGGAATVAFAVWWFGEVGGHCGVVRFYEQALGSLLVGGWLVGTAGGLVLARVGRRPGTARVAAGSLLAILVSVAATGAYLALVQEVWEGDYTRKGTDELLSRLVGKDNDARILAARALGERGAVEALPRFCAILDDRNEDINLRHNAAFGLGRVCRPPVRAGVDVERALASLVRAAQERGETLPLCAIEALGESADERAVGPLAELLEDASRPVHTRTEAARALGTIGGEAARDALAKALPKADDDLLASTIRRALEAGDRPLSPR